MESYRADQPIVGTHFFYWYDFQSKEHFVNYDGTDALTDHPVKSEGYSYKSAAWWKRELLEVMAAGDRFYFARVLGVSGHPGFVELCRDCHRWCRHGKSWSEKESSRLEWDCSTIQAHSATIRESGRWIFQLTRESNGFTPQSATTSRLSHRRCGQRSRGGRLSCCTHLFPLRSKILPCFRSPASVSNATSPLTCFWSRISAGKVRPTPCVPGVAHWG